MLPTDDALLTLADASPETREALLDAVREAKGRRAIRPAETVEAAVLDVDAYLVVPAWSAGQDASALAADVLRDVHGVEACAAPGAWSVYTEAARRLGFVGTVPVPTVGLGRETGPVALA